MARVILKDDAGDRIIELVDPITVAGRDPANKIVLDDKKASRRHCQIEKTEFGYKLVDLESRNGTAVNDRVVNQALLRPGDRVRIGNRTLIFEDPDFREPSAEVAARFAPLPDLPEAPPPVRAALPAAPPERPAAVGRASTSAAATDPGPLPGLRRRSVRALAVHEAVRERKTLATVGVLAGLFLFMVLVLIIVSTMTGEDPAYGQAQKAYDDARRMHVERPYDALELLKKIPAEPRALRAQADALARKIQDDLARQVSAAGEAEQKDFDELYAFCEANRANPLAYDRMFAMCSEFKRKYPGSRHLVRVDEYARIAHEGRQASARAAVAAAEKQIAESLKARDFGDAVRHALGLLERVQGNIEAFEAAGRLKDGVIDQAAAHFQAEDARAKELRSQGRADDARQLYRDLILRMGDGRVDELRDYCEIARRALQALQ